MTTIVYGCCVGSWDKFERYVQPQVNVLPINGERRCITRYGADAIASAYNTVLDEVCADPRGVPDALILLHDDLEILDVHAELKFLTTLHNDHEVALLGVAGARRCPTLAWWEHDPVGHQLTDAGLIDFGARVAEVRALEGSIIVMAPWAIENLRFDERYPGFHGYDCDIAMQARAQGRSVFVVDVDTHHHTSPGFKTPEVASSWWRSDALFQDKWWS